MAGAIVLAEAPQRRSRRTRRSRGLGAPVTAPETGTCKCSYNPRTKRYVESCYVGQSRLHRSGWKFTKGGGTCGRRG